MKKIEVEQDGYITDEKDTYIARHAKNAHRSVQKPYERCYNGYCRGAYEASMEIAEWLDKIIDDKTITDAIRNTARLYAEAYEGNR